MGKDELVQGFDNQSPVNFFNELNWEVSLYFSLDTNAIDDNDKGKINEGNQTTNSCKRKERNVYWNLKTYDEDSHNWKRVSLEELEFFLSSFFLVCNVLKLLKVNQGGQVVSLKSIECFGDDPDHSSHSKENEEEETDFKQDLHGITNCLAIEVTSC